MGLAERDFLIRAPLASRGYCQGANMRDDRTGNEPAPLLLFGLAVIPVFAVLAWFALA